MIGVPSEALHVLGIDPIDIHKAPTHVGMPKDLGKREEVCLLFGVWLGLEHSFKS